MIGFQNDYSEGAHEQIIAVLSQGNREQSEVYGDDSYSDNAKRLIREQLQQPNCEIRFLIGGTQTNLVAISHFLRPHQAVIAADTGHINVHETGAIEATGHKVIAVRTEDGKLTPAHIEAVLNEHTDFHMVQPKMVYLSNATEIGTIYRKAELASLREICDQRGLFLYIDGARLASALTSKDNDVAFSDYPRFADAFYIGGTKNGALFGEALVIVNEAYKKDIDYTIKQRGALLAKGRMLGLQFEALFQDGLYEVLGAHANQMAEKLKQGLLKAGYTFLCSSDTNQQFPILEKSLIEKLSAKYTFNVCQEIDALHSVVRFVTSWATTEAAVDALLGDLAAKK